MAKKNQSTRLTNQHKKSQGVVGIFGEEAKFHDMAKILEAKAKKLGLTLTTFCTNLIFEYTRKEVDKK